MMPNCCYRRFSIGEYIVVMKIQLGLLMHIFHLSVPKILFKGCNWWTLPQYSAEIMPISAFSRVVYAQRISENFGFYSQMDSKLSKHDLGLPRLHVLGLLLCQELFFEIWISRIHLMLHNISLRMTLSKCQQFSQCLWWQGCRISNLLLWWNIDS